MMHCPCTPAFVFSLGTVRENVELIRAITRPLGASVLYSLKACAVPALVSEITDCVDGLSVSSIYELYLARSLDVTNLQWISMALEPKWSHEICTACDRITLNSTSQLHQFAHLIAANASVGMRINPSLTVVDDPRYDPCRHWSKLGVRADSAVDVWRALSDLSGIHCHTGCCIESWEPLLRTIKALESQCAEIMYAADWINIGGGYQWNAASDFGPFEETLKLLTNDYGLKVLFEPGNGIVNSAGSLHASVIDLFASDGKKVAVLDTTVNHLPEVFEYQYEPDVTDHVEGAAHEYILAGCSCLAGDLFGEYSFEEPLGIGSRITFENVGAYSLVKANMFNGINLPSIYIQREDGELELVREFTYEDFLARCGGEAHAVARAGV